MGDSAFRTNDGIPKIYVTHRPHETTTVFMGCGDDYDNGVIGDGPKILFDLLATDISKTIDLQFITDVFIKDGMMHTVNAPFGACLDISVVAPNGYVMPAHHPTMAGYTFSEETILSRYGVKIPLLDSGWFPLDTEDRGQIYAGMILRLTVHNSDPANGEDPAVAFRMAGRIEMFR